MIYSTRRSHQQNPGYSVKTFRDVLALIFGFKTKSSSNFSFHFRSILATISLLGLLVMPLTGCMRHKTHDPKVKANQFFGDDADFDLVGVMGEIRPEEAQFASVRGWKIPLYQTYRFRAEVRDASSRNTLRDFPFQVLDEDGQEICQAPETLGGEPKCRYVANAQSQIVWVEKVPYDYFKGRPEPVRVIRKIKGLGARRGVRTAVLQLNPWAYSRGLPNSFMDLTFELTEDLAQPLVDPGYRSASKFRFSSPDDSSELVIRDLVRQVYQNTDPILVGRSDSYLESFQEDFQTKDLIFSRYEPSEFVRRRPMVRKEIEQDKSMTETQRAEKLKIFDSKNVEPISQLIQGDRNIYVYRENADSLPNIDGIKFDIQLLMKLGFRYSNLSDGNTVAEISAGRFRVFAHMVLEPASGSKPVLLTPGIAPLEAEIARNNDLQLDYEAIIPYYPSAGMIKLALKIIPLGVTQGLKPVDRLFTIGTFSQLIGRTGGLIEDKDSRDNLFVFDDYINEAESGEKAFQDGSVDVAREFQVGDLDIRFATVEAGETAAQRTVIFSVNTKILDETTNTPVGDNVRFEVVSLHTDYANPTDKEKWKFFKITNGEKTTDPSRVRDGGKITFFDTITHKYYQVEQLVERNIFIAKWKSGLDLKKQVQEWAMASKGSLDDQPLPAGVQKLKIYINPWDEKFGTFGRDARAVSDNFLEKVQGREKIPPRFFIGDFGYETLRFRYKIENDMKLNVKKTVLLNMTPRVLRYSSILEGINSIYSLRDGIYLMKTAIQKDYLDPSARNEADIFQIPFKLEDAQTMLKTQDESLLEIEGMSEKTFIEVNAPPGKSQVTYGGRENPVTNAYDKEGNLDPSARTIPYNDSYKDPRRKRAMSMVKKLVRVNAGRVITPVEFSIEDLRLMRIRQQFFVQLEPVNQVRLQMVKLVTDRFEQIFQIKLGKNSPVLSQMTPQEEARVKSLMSRAVDAVANAVSDDVYVTEIADLENIIKDSEVEQAFAAFENARFRNQSLDLRLKDILRQIKVENDEVKALETDIINITEDEAKAREQEVVGERNSERQRHNQRMAALQELRDINLKNNENKAILERQCGNLNPIEVYYDESKINKSASDKIDAVTRALIPFDTGIFDDEYSDNVSKFQPFAKVGEQFFESLINQTTLNQILTNDFTLNPAFSSVSNLDMLIDQKSGIKARTFVGPMTFLYNTNRGSLRPTDNLDEAYCESDDCNALATSIDSQYGEIQNYEYEKSPFHGSIAHFQNVTFNDQDIIDERTGLGKKIKGLETMFYELQYEKEAYKKVEGLLTRYLDHFDMSYVSLTDQSIDRLICREDIWTDRCFVKDTEKTVPLDNFISEYSNTVNEVVNLDYKNTPENIELKFQTIVSRPRQGQNDYLDFSNISAMALPWGFVSPAYQKDEYRCELGLPGLENVCAADNERKRLGGLYTSYNVEAAFAAPSKSELDGIIRFPFKGQQMVPAKAAEFDQNIESKMCDLLIYGEIARVAKAAVKSEADKLELRRDLFNMSLRCQTDINNGLSPVVIERKFRISDTGRYYFLGGKSMNINASQDVRISSGIRVSRNFGVRPLRIITGIIEKGRSFISAAMALVIGSLDFTYAIQRDRGFYEGTGITSGTYLVMQNAEFEIELTEYEQCLTVRWSPDFVEKYSRHINFSDGKFSEFYVRALMLCSGIKERTPVAVNEKYYYFTQHFTEGDMLDPADIHNHPWLLSLRGMREFSAFMLSLKQWQKDDSTNKYNPEFVHGEELVGYSDFVKSDIENVKKRAIGDTNPTGHYAITQRPEKWPIDQMVNTYKRVLPTYPGTYTQLNEVDYNDRSWPWAVGEPGAVMEASRECSQ